MKEDVYLKQKEEKYLHKKFGFLTIKKIYRDEKKQVRCLCDCECGNRKDTLLQNVISGSTKSCGCMIRTKILEKMIGKRYAHLTVMRMSGRDRWGASLWECQCDCGGTIIASTGDLKRGYKKDCGCHYDLKQYMLRHEFGYLTPIEYIEDNGKEKWKCRCRCGNKCIVSGSNLRNHHTRSCGCLVTEKRKERLIDLTGQQFGRLKVIERTEKKQSGLYLWKCQCQCGNIVEVLASNLKSGKVKSCGCLQRSVGKENFKKNFIFKDHTFINGVLSKTIPKNNTTGVKGVFYNKKSGCYVAAIGFQGKSMYLGSRRTLAEAAELRKQAEKEREAYVREILMKE